MGLITPRTHHFDWEGSDVIACSHCLSAQPGLNQQFRIHMVLLQGLREWWGNAIYITSGWRCPVHNKAEGGSSGSQHLIVRSEDPARLRFATDVGFKLPSVHVPQKMAQDAVVIFARRALDVGFTGVGVYEDDGHVHLDCRRLKAREKPKVWGDRLEEWATWESE